MSSANNTLEGQDGDTSAEQECLPTTTSVLDKSRSLFGNSSTVLSTPLRDPTPDVQSGESSAITDPLVAMETETKPEPSAGETTSETSPETAQEKEEEPMDTTDSVVHSSDEPTDPKPEEADEIFEKKVVSMDTSQDNIDDPAAATEAMETDNGEEEKAEENEIEDEEEEEETPRKKAKRAAPISEDDEASNSEEPVEKEVEPVAEQQKEPATAKETVQAVESDETLSLVIDESAEKSVESEVAPGEHPETEMIEEEHPEDPVEHVEEEMPDDQEPMEEEEEQPETSSRRSRGRKSSASASTPASSGTPRRGGRGRVSQAHKEPEEKEVVEEPPKKRRSSRGKKEEPAEEVEEAPEEQLEEVAADEGSAKKTRSRRSAAQPVVPSEDGAEEQEEQDPQTPKRGGRARRSAAAAAPPTPRSTRGKGRKSNVEPEQTEKVEEEQEETVEDETEQPEEEKEEEEAVPEEPEVPTSSRRSTRSKAAPKPVTTTPAPTKRTPARGRRKQHSLTEETIEEADETVETTPPTKKGRGVKSAPSSSKKKDEYDPYDLDTEMEHHPEPLKNIHMEVKNFGAVTYAKVGSSESKYANTEKAAESRIGDLNATTPSKSRRSLADMTPGKEKVKHRMSIPSGRRSRGKKDEPGEEVDADMEEESKPTSSATPASASRPKKRKSDAVDTVTSAKKQAVPVLEEYDDEEQLKIDHPDDDNEPHAPGARVYANFQKTFYPAIVLSERDGLGRYKVLFTDDKVVKDVPNAGIIPLRAVASGKTAIFEENDVIVSSGVSDISAEIWFKGKIQITILDDDGEPTEETKIVDWSNISFDQVEWKDYIKSKEQNATAVVTSNITTMSEATRARKPASAKLPAAISKGRKPKSGGDLASSRGASSPRSPLDEDEDKLLPMNEEAIGKNIFAGKMFMLTSANRSNSSSISPMFKKKNLMEFISQNGGVVTEQLNEALPKHEPLLISDTYYRTHKYLAALARGIPCVSNLWLQACGERGECVDYRDYILPAGCSIFDDQDMPAPENPSCLLSGKTVYVHSTHVVREVTQTGPGGTFVEIWMPILKLLGANVLEADWETLREMDIKFDVVLVDGTFRDEVMDYADEINASKVTSEWVIQTIILGGPPEATAHPKFDPYRLHHRSH